MIVSIDPGDTTGLYMSSGTHSQFSEFHVVEAIVAVHDYVGIQHVIMERFNLYDKRTKANAGWALDVIGAVTFWCWQHEIPLSLQWNRDKNKVTDTMLADAGMLKTPKKEWRHANDAARHYLYWRTRNR